MQKDVRSRIAPTPSGYLHLGNAFNFFLTEELTKAAGGMLRLRIDDLDAPRVRKEYLEDIFESLAWLGIAPEEGPKNIAEQVLFSQHNRLDRYAAMLQQLAKKGLVFACTCSRRDLHQNNEAGQYMGTCMERGIPLNTPDAAWRIRTPEADSGVDFKDEIMGRQQIDLWTTQRHFIVRRRDGLPAYQIASLCDDVDYDVNTIVRGEDLLESTAAQLYLARLLGEKLFLNSRFYHHPLLKDEAGGKLSKSTGSTSLQALRASGVSGQDVRAMAREWFEGFI